MPQKNEVFVLKEAEFDTTIFDNATDLTYDFMAWAPRHEVAKAGSLAAAQALPIWYIERTTRVSPHVTTHASVEYDQVYDAAIAGTITSWEA